MCFSARFGRQQLRLPSNLLQNLPFAWVGCWSNCRPSTGAGISNYFWWLSFMIGQFFSVEVRVCCSTSEHDKEWLFPVIPSLCAAVGSKKAHIELSEFYDPWSFFADWKPTFPPLRLPLGVFFSTSLLAIVIRPDFPPNSGSTLLYLAQVVTSRTVDVSYIWECALAQEVLSFSQLVNC